MGSAVTTQAAAARATTPRRARAASPPRALTAREERDTRAIVRSRALHADDNNNDVTNMTPTPPTPPTQAPTTPPPRRRHAANDRVDNAQTTTTATTTTATATVTATSARHPRQQMLERVAHEGNAHARAPAHTTERAASPPCRTPPERELHTDVDNGGGGAAVRTHAFTSARSVSPAAALGAYTALPLSVVRATLQRSHAVYRVCLTGGPCAGKSTMLAYAQTQLPRRTGFRVLCVPEAATLLVTSGMQWDDALRIEQQLTVLRTQLALEDTLYALACATALPTVLLCDRGTMDGRAFCSDDEFAEVLRRLGCSADVLRDRYDAVVHLITAACGAEAYYTLDNNSARYENVDAARASDRKLRQMYVGHANLHLIDNATSFAEKMERGLRVILRLIDCDGGGGGGSMERAALHDDDGRNHGGDAGHDTNMDGNEDRNDKKKCVADATTTTTTWQRVTGYYLVRHCPDVLPTPSAEYDVTTTILCNSQLDDVRLLVRRTTANGSSVHFFVSVRQAAAVADASARDNDDNNVRAAAAAAAAATTTTYNATPPPPSQQQQQRVERVQRISSKEYASLLRHRDMACADVVVHARHFLYEQASCELATFVAPRWVRGKQTLSVEYEVARRQQRRADDATRNGNDSGHDDDDDDDSASLSSSSATAAASSVPLPRFVDVDREVPLERTTATFLVAHAQTGALYTSLVFAPVFSRAVRGCGGHVDVEDVVSRTQSLSRRSSVRLQLQQQPQQQQQQQPQPPRDAATTTTSAAVATTTTPPPRPHTPPRHGDEDEAHARDDDDSNDSAPSVPVEAKTSSSPLQLRDVNAVATTSTKPTALRDKVPLLPRIAPPPPPTIRRTHTVRAYMDAGAHANDSGDTTATATAAAAPPRERPRRHRRAKQHAAEATGAARGHVASPTREGVAPPLYDAGDDADKENVPLRA